MLSTSPLFSSAQFIIAVTLALLLLGSSIAPVALSAEVEEAACDADGAEDGTCSSSSASSSASSAAASGNDCSDADDRCKGWASAGECEKNPGYMEEHCKKSCGTCVEEERIECADSNVMCVGWAGSGECESNPVYMEKHCRKSCKLCGVGGGGGGGAVQKDDDDPTCVDSHDSCPEWAKAGECEANAGYMRKNCQKSCGTCGSDADDVVDNDPCRDVRVEDCPGWAEQGECESNPPFMKENCARSCRHCDPINDTCEDMRGKRCEERARDGECVLEELKMKRECRESCAFCVDEERARRRGESEETIAKKLLYQRLRRDLSMKQTISGTKDEQRTTRESIVRIESYIRDVLSATTTGGAASDELRMKCRNKSKYCAYWAGRGRCDDQAEFMGKQCPLACMACLD